MILNSSRLVLITLLLTTIMNPAITLELKATDGETIVDSKFFHASAMIMPDTNRSVFKGKKAAPADEDIYGLGWKYRSIENNNNDRSVVFKRTSETNRTLISCEEVKIVTQNGETKVLPVLQSRSTLHFRPSSLFLVKHPMKRTPPSVSSIFDYLKAEEPWLKVDERSSIEKLTAALKKRQQATDDVAAAKAYQKIKPYWALVYIRPYSLELESHRVELDANWQNNDEFQRYEIAFFEDEAIANRVSEILEKAKREKVSSIRYNESSSDIEISDLKANL